MNLSLAEWNLALASGLIYIFIRFRDSK